MPRVRLVVPAIAEGSTEREEPQDRRVAHRLFPVFQPRPQRSQALVRPFLVVARSLCAWASTLDFPQIQLPSKSAPLTVPLLTDLTLLLDVQAFATLPTVAEIAIQEHVLFAFRAANGEVLDCRLVGEHQPGVCDQERKGEEKKEEADGEQRDDEAVDRPLLIARS